MTANEKKAFLLAHGWTFEMWDGARMWTDPEDPTGAIWGTGTAYERASRRASESNGTESKQ